MAKATEEIFGHCPECGGIEADEVRKELKAANEGLAAEKKENKRLRELNSCMGKDWGKDRAELERLRECIDADSPEFD